VKKHKKKKVDIVDCLVHQYAKDWEMSVFSFDRDLNKKLPGA
jgi:predicted nucleic acid-binding protein